MARAELQTVVSFLDQYLDIAGIPDYPGAENGLQTENTGAVTKIAACTDACQATIDAAARRGADLMLVHHGLFWGRGITPVVARNYRRVRALIQNDIALYAAHLPLDAHPELGNNARLAELIGLGVDGRFGEFEGTAIGVRGVLEIDRDELALRLETALGRASFVIPAGPGRCRNVGIVTGGGGSLIQEAAAAGLDTFITGEGAHHTYFDAEELELNVYFAGHYATETLGVKALAEKLAEKFGLEWEFIDHPTGL